MRTLWCGSLSEKVDDRILYELFLNAGPLEKVTIPRDKETGKQKPFAFILFCHPESVKYAVILLNNTALFGQHIKLQHRESGLGVSTGPSSASRLTRAGTGGHWRSLSVPECLPQPAVSWRPPPPPLPSPVYTQPPPPPPPPVSTGLEERSRDWDRRGSRGDSRLRTQASSPDRRGRREKSRSRRRRSRSRSWTRSRRDGSRSRRSRSRRRRSRSRRSRSRTRNRRDRSRSRRSRSRSRNRRRRSGSRRRYRSPRSYSYSYRSMSRRN